VPPESAENIYFYIEIKILEELFTPATECFLGDKLLKIKHTPSNNLIF
jgi:hypothetical protein